MIKISSSILPDIYPIVTYQDKTYIDSRIIKNGVLSQVFATEEKYQTVNDTWERERNIQTIIYDRYMLSFFVKENNSINLLQYADFVTIEDLDAGIIHHARILDISENKVSETHITRFVLTYYDVNPINYKQFLQPKNSFLERENLLNQYDVSQLVKLNIKTVVPANVMTSDGLISTNDYTFYTSLLPKKDVSEAKLEQTEVDGVKITTYVAMQSMYRVVFFCKTDEMVLMKKYLPQCVPSLTQGYCNATLIINGVSIANIEPMTPDVKKIEGSIDLYQVDIMFKWLGLANYQYS